MKKLLLLGLAASALALSGASLQNATLEKEERDAHIIVQLSSNPENKSAQTLKKEQDIVLNYIRNNITSNIRVDTRFSSLFSGFILDVNASYVSHIRDVPGVAHIDYDELHSVTYSEDDLVSIKNAVELATTTKNISAETMEVPEENNEGEGTFIAILDTGFMINATFGSYKNVDHEAFTDLAKSVNVKETKSTINKRIKNYSNFHGKPDSKHSVYHNRKVPFFYDYGGETNVRHTVGEEDFDVYAPGQDHGNHVATIAAGNADNYKGIAPKAQLALMKVFTVYNPTPADKEEGYTTSTGAYDSAIVKALEDCYALGVDIVSMSLGSALNDFNDDSIAQQMIRKIEEKGVFVNVAGGNEGKETFANSPYEYWSTDMVETGILSSYSNNEASMTIASAQPDEQYYDTAFMVNNHTVSFKDQIESYTDSEGNEVTYKPERHFTDLLVDHPDGQFEWVKVPNLGDTSDYDEIDAEGKIAVVDRGELTFVAKITNAQNNGAIAVAIIDNDPSQTDFTFRFDLSGWTPKVPVVLILNRDKTIFDTATDFTCQLLTNTIATNPEKRTVSSFSSDGPTYDLRIKPEISAPGSNILGGVLDSPTAYDYYSGTSMATPNYSGAMAVLLSQHLGDEEWRETLNARLMSTAEPMKDKFGTNFESVRKQGAGLLNLESAFDSDVVLFTKGSTKKAKIEIGNDASLQEGELNLSFDAVNYSDSDITYSATVYVYRPALAQVSNENYADLMGVNYQATYEKLIDTHTFDGITVPAGELHTIDLTFSLDSDELEVINDEFEYGCYIEGFIVLTAENQPDLSIPYLGFYGDLEDAIPVEPFKFERDNTKIYPSDIANSVMYKWGGSSYVDYASDWVQGYYDSFDDISMTDLIYNEANLRTMAGSNQKQLISVGTNPYTGEVDSHDIYVGNNGQANTMIIQQYVMRSVATNTITLKNKATGQTILVDHMYDSLFGAEVDDYENEIAWPLYKSHVDIDYWSSAIYAHRAYTIIPMYRYNHDTGDFICNYPDGEYDMTFTYVMQGGGTYEKNYTVHLDSKAPTVKEIKDVSPEGQEGTILRVYYDEEALSYGALSYDPTTNSTFLFSEDENGFYVDVETSNFYPTADKSKATIEGIDYSFGSSTTVIHSNDENMIALSSANFTPSTNFIETITDVDEYSKTLSFAFKRYNVTKEKWENFITMSGNITVTMKLFSGFNVDDVKVLELPKGKSSTQKLISSSVSNGFITFTGAYSSTFTITCDPSISGEIRDVSIATSVWKDTFFVGEEFNADDLLVFVTDSVGQVSLADKSEVIINSSAFNSNVEGSYTISVSYKGLTANYTVKVVKTSTDPVIGDLPDVKPVSKSSGCGGNITTYSAVIAILAGLGLILTSFKKKEN